jgi:type I restriction enzyme S subunit
MKSFYFVNGNNLSDGKIIIKENTRQVDLIEFDKHRRELNEHTLLLSINGTIGNLALYNGEPIILGKSACYINFNEMIMREFGYILLSSLGFLQYAKQVATGATIQNVPLKGIRNYKFNLPSLEEQKIIIGLVNQYINFANTIEAQVKKTQERVDNLTQSILAKAFRGELVAQDPNDEPAEKLLERIAQARKEAEALAKAAKKVAKTK